MVFVNSQKFACASCIKGHRSSSCHHADRPLFEIKKKGRPISQCERCRALRKDKRVHVKCTCPNVAAFESNQTVDDHCDRTAQRKIPSTPTLPNGLRDILSRYHSYGLEGINSKRRVDSLLNPCNCKSILKCKCIPRFVVPDSNHPNTASRSKGDDSSVIASVTSSSQSCCGGERAGVPTLENDSSHGEERPRVTDSSCEDDNEIATSSYILFNEAGSSKSRLQDDSDAEVNVGLSFDLPPLKQPVLDWSDVDGPTLPSLKHMFPSTQGTNDLNESVIAALTSCCCGHSCVCPGCKEHRGEEFISPSDEDCPDKCGTCVDNMGGTAIPTSYSVTLTPTSTDAKRHCHTPRDTHGRSHGKDRDNVLSSLDHFAAIAALLPPPPPSRIGGRSLDPTNVAVYQHVSGSKQDWRKAAGLVQIPPLTCCQGSCKCPGGMCGCRSKCSGSCGGHDSVEHNREATTTVNYRDSGNEIGNSRPGGGCCMGQKTQESP